MLRLNGLAVVLLVLEQRVVGRVEDEARERGEPREDVTRRRRVLVTLRSRVRVQVRVRVCSGQGSGQGSGLS